MKRRKLTRKQRKYFAKRVSPKRRRHYSMARHRYRGYARRGIGGMKSMIAPILGGFGDHYLNSMLPISGVASTGIGFVFHNETVKNIGLYQIGHSLGNIIPIPGFGGASTGGGF